MRRREFITGLGSAAAWPIAARAQQSAMPLIGYLSAGTPRESVDVVAAFRKGLSEMGYVEGRNVAIEFRWAENDLGRLPELAADLVRHRVAVITPLGTAAALAAKAATSMIPIVFIAAADAVYIGLVTSLNRPGANVTGFDNLSGELGPKRLGLIHELLPRATRFALLLNPGTARTDDTIPELRKAAAAIGREIEFLYVGTNPEIDTAFASLAEKRIDALLVERQFLFTERRAQILGLAARHAVPVIYSNREDVEAGGLMSYGSNNSDSGRQQGIYAGRVLKSEKPADLPVMRTTRFEFVINLQTAKLLGIEVPPRLLAIADAVIE